MSSLIKKKKRVHVFGQNLEFSGIPYLFNYRVGLVKLPSNLYDDAALDQDMCKDQNMYQLPHQYPAICCIQRERA